MEPTVTSSPQRPGYWRAATIFCLLLLVLGTTAGVSMFEQFSAQVRDLQQRVQKTAQLRYVAVLLDDKNQAAMLLTQLAGDSFVQLQRLNAVVEGGEDSMQLWLVPASGPALSLGVLTAKLKTLRLEISEQLLSDGARLAISVENKGGVSERQGPRLPYLLTGTLIRKAL
jgi:anti-sigma-K factor RskA